MKSPHHSLPHTADVKSAAEHFDNVVKAAGLAAQGKIKLKHVSGGSVTQEPSPDGAGVRYTITGPAVFDAHPADAKAPA